MLGFAAAFAVVQPLPDPSKELVASAVAGIGAVVSLVGFAGITFRWFPLAMPAQGLWRLSSVLTYSDAAGLLLVVALLVAMGLDETKWWVRGAVCLCLAGVVATQSRGALIALVCGLPLLPVERYRRLTVPLVTGVAAGVLAVGSSSRSTAVPDVGVGLVIALLTAVAVRPGFPRSRRGGSTWTRQRKVLLGIVAVLMVFATALAIRNEIQLRALAPSDQDRSVEWSAAVHQFRVAPLVGVGPDRTLFFHSSDGDMAHFAHNEYLQVAADSGAVGLSLLLLTVIGIGATVRRRDLLSSSAIAALVAFGVGGAFDFDWHLPMIALAGGCVAGLASSTNKEKT
jgi:O-antigen ligase